MDTQTYSRSLWPENLLRSIRGVWPPKEARLVTRWEEVSSKDVFVAIRGTQVDTHKKLKEVCSQTPVALVVENETEVPSTYLGTVIVVKSSRQALSFLAGEQLGHPSQSVFLFGVTGTNGKTSCTYLMEKILTELGLATGVIGTIEHRLGNQIWPTNVTTPGPLELQRRFWT